MVGDDTVYEFWRKPRKSDGGRAIMYQKWKNILSDIESQVYDVADHV